MTQRDDLLPVGRSVGTAPGDTFVIEDPVDFNQVPPAPRFAKGHYQAEDGTLSGAFYTTQSGWYRFDVFDLKKRIVLGEFDVVMETDEGESVHLVGEFELCGFQIETKSGIK